MDINQFSPSPVMTDVIVRDAFVDMLRACGVVGTAARRLGIAKQTLYRARAKFPGFAAAWDAAAGKTAETPDGLEAALLDRAINGVERRRFYGGQQIDTYREYFDRLAMFMLAARMPEKYGAGGATEQDDAIVPITREEFMAKIRAAQRSAPLMIADGMPG